MDEKTVIQNIFGTVHGHVVGGNVTQHQPPGPTHEQLRARIRQAKRHKLKAMVGSYVNMPAVCMLPLLAYLVSRVPFLLQVLLPIQRTQQIPMPLLVEMVGLIAVLILLSFWHQNIRRRHARTIQYARKQIDRDELALQFHHR